MHSSVHSLRTAPINLFRAEPDEVAGAEQPPGHQFIENESPTHVSSD
jgi:hypothetical protein